MKRFIVAIMTIIMLIAATACNNHEEDTTEKAENINAEFENSVFIGDSITYGFVVNEIIPEDRIIGGAGTTAGLAYFDIDGLADMKADNIFIMLGSDDLYMPVEDPKELFRTDMTKLINKIKEELPNCKIYLQSVMPVTQEALDEEPRYEHIGEYNEILQEIADKLSVNYVDISFLVEENPDLFAEDGIHFKKELYPLWLKKLSESL